MPVKPDAKARQHRITPEAVEAYATAKRTRDTYMDCLRAASACLSTDRSRHCQTCASYRRRGTRSTALWAFRLRAVAHRRATPAPPAWAGAQRQLASRLGPGAGAARADRGGVRALTP